MPKNDVDGMAALQALVARAGDQSRGLPPVERWEPEYCGALDIEIRRDGTWFYMGTPIGRKALARLFSTVLRKDEDGQTYLVTPVEKIRIQVEDAHFLGVELNAHIRDGRQILTVRTNMDDIVEIDEQHPIRFEKAEGNEGVKPYILVRGRLEALLTRAAMYELINHGDITELDGVATFAIESNGIQFPLMAQEELDALVGAQS